jgi:hypothetical protein
MSRPAQQRKPMTTKPVPRVQRTSIDEHPLTVVAPPRHASHIQNHKSTNLPRITIREALFTERTKSVWKHGAELKTQFRTFHVDQELVQRHLPLMKEIDKNIDNILTRPLTKECDWQTLYTHPKLMQSYFWKDKHIHDTKQRVQDLESALFERKKIGSKKVGKNEETILTF